MLSLQQSTVAMKLSSTKDGNSALELRSDLRGKVTNTLPLENTFLTNVSKFSPTTSSRPYNLENRILHELSSTSSPAWLQTTKGTKDDKYKRNKNSDEIALTNKCFKHNLIGNTQQTRNLLGKALVSPSILTVNTSDSLKKNAAVIISNKKNTVEPKKEGQNDQSCKVSKEPVLHSSPQPHYELSLPPDKDKGYLLSHQFYGDSDPFRPRLSSLYYSNEETARIAKIALINEVAVSLLKSPNFKSKSDETRNRLIMLANDVMELDPEFVLKVALYTRKELNIRTTANFLISYAAMHSSCRLYLSKYFQLSVMLPTDWIEIAELYQWYDDNSINFGSLPSALRRAMVKKFPDFDEYQLAKYNRDKKKSEKRTDSEREKMPHHDVVLDPESETEVERERKTFTLKQLIRKLHIHEPVYNVMCLLGKKYPEDSETFRISRLPGMWDSDRAGKRMKLATPETWETQVSLKGNKASTWETLLDHRKLPYMAMLRNIRNMLKAGIDDKHHKMVLKKISDEVSVINSKQFPLRYLSAFSVLDELEKELNLDEKETSPEWTLREGIRSLSRGRAQGRGQRGRGGQIHCDAKRRGIGRGRGESKAITKTERPLEYNQELLDSYRKALETALKIATYHNLKPIPGTTYIILKCDMSCLEIYFPSRGLGAKRTWFQNACLLSLMCKACCEDSQFVIFCGERLFVPKLDGKESLLVNVEKIRSQAMTELETSALDFNYFYRLCSEKKRVDNVILMGGDFSLNENVAVTDIVYELRQLVNKKLLYVQIELDTVGQPSEPEKGNPLDVKIYGYSDQILRFIAERGSENQLAYVDNIDVAYQLQDIKIKGKPEISTSSEFVPSQIYDLPGRKTVRVFISSTFKDMHGERDLLTRFVFPELRARAADFFVDVYEIDLRWGITEHEAKSDRQIEICLSEVAKADFFVGILGDRYGWIPEEYTTNGSPELEWLQTIPKGKSITELEMIYFATLNQELARKRGFFYIRDQNFLSDVPDEYEQDFKSENCDAMRKLCSLKSVIAESGMETYENYPCEWAGVVDGKPMVTGLQDFGTRVLNNLWNAIKASLDPLDGFATGTEKEKEQKEEWQHIAYAKKISDTFAQRALPMKHYQAIIHEGKIPEILLIAGKSGCGKSALMAKLVQNFKEVHEFAFCIFVDALKSGPSIVSLVNELRQSLSTAFQLNMVNYETYGEVIIALHELFKKISKKALPVVSLPIFIDGIDKVELVPGSTAFDWLPSEIPKGISFIITCLENGPHQKILTTQWKSVEVLKIGPMNIFERKDMVRRVLQQHRKELDQSAFNNQMKVLLSKRESNSPMYLKIACEELRLYGVFDQFSDYLKRMPQTVNLLIQSVLQRLEDEYGKNFVKVVLVCIFLSRQGLAKEELFQLVNIALKLHDLSVKGTSLEAVRDSLAFPEPEIPVAVFSQVCRAFQGYLSQADKSRFAFAPGVFKDMVWQRYIKGSKPEMLTKLHVILAGYYKVRADPLNKREYDGRDQKALNEVTYHLIRSSCWNELKEVLCSILFIHQRLKHGDGQQLLEDFEADVPAPTQQFKINRKKFLEDSKVKAYRNFLSRNIHILVRYPVMVFQQAYNEPDTSFVHQDVKGITTDAHVVTWINKPSRMSFLSQTFTGFSQQLLCVTFSPDNKSIACGARNGELRMFDVASGKELKTFRGHGDAISSTCFVGVNRLCAASWDGTLSIWDVNGGHRVHLLEGHSRRVVSCCAVPSSKKVISASWDSTARIWNSEDGKVVMTFKGMSGKPINCIACTSDGNLVALGGWNRMVVLWDIVNNKRLKVLKGHQGSIRALAFSKNATQLISASVHGDLIFWSVKAGVKVGEFTCSQEALTALQFAKDGHEMVTTGNDAIIKVWSGGLGRPASVPYLKDEDTCMDEAVSVSINSLSTEVAVGYHSGYVKAYDLRSGQNSCKERLHTSRINSICWSKDGTFLVTGSNDSTAKLVCQGKQMCSLEGHLAAVRCVCLSDAYICTASDDYTLMIWPALFLDSDYKPKPQQVLSAHTAPVTCCDFSACGLKLVSGGNDKTLVIWNLITFEPLYTLHDAHKDWITCCAWSDIGDYVVTGSNDFNMKVWDTKTGTEKFVIKGNESTINSVDYKFGCIVSAAYDGTIRLWTQRGAEITVIRAHKARANDCKIWAPRLQEEAVIEDDWQEEEATGMSRTKKEAIRQPKLEDILLFTASDEGHVGVWQPFMPNALRTFLGHSDVVSSADVTKSGGHVITCSHDQSIRLWMNSEESTEEYHNGEVTSVVANAQGNCVLSAGRDGKVIMWKLARDMLDSKIVLSHKPIQVSSVAVTCVTFVTDSEQFVCGDREGNLVLWNPNGTVSETLLNDDLPIRKIKSLRDSRFAVLRYMDCIILDRKMNISQRIVADHWFPTLFCNIMVMPDLNSTVIIDNALSIFLLAEKDVDRRKSELIYTLNQIEGLVQKEKDVEEGGGGGEEKEEEEETISCFDIENVDTDKVEWNLCCDAQLNEAKTMTLAIGKKKEVEVRQLRLQHGTYEEIKTDKMDHGNDVTCITFCNSLLVSGSADGSIKIWDLGPCKQVGLFFTETTVTSLEAFKEPVSEHIIIVYGDKNGKVGFLEFV